MYLTIFNGTVVTCFYTVYLWQLQLPAFYHKIDRKVWFYVLHHSILSGNTNVVWLLILREKSDIQFTEVSLFVLSITINKQSFTIKYTDMELFNRNTIDFPSIFVYSEVLAPTATSFYHNFNRIFLWYVVFI